MNSAKKKQQLKRKTLRLWFEAYIQPDCELCPNRAIQLHHFYYKGSYPYARYLKSNGISLCRGCHFVLHHQDPKKMEERIIKKRGVKWLNKLKKDREIIPRMFDSIIYYEGVIKELSSNKDWDLSE